MRPSFLWVTELQGCRAAKAILYVRPLDEPEHQGFMDSALDMGFIPSGDVKDLIVKGTQKYVTLAVLYCGLKLSYVVSLGTIPSQG